MTLFKLTALLFLWLPAYAVYAGNCLPSLPKAPVCNKDCSVDVCCGKMGGINYCDASAGRYVCHNGFYSTCYCTKHAIMDLQQVEGCCLWQGGVLKTTYEGIVICKDGAVSPICSNANQKIQ